MLELNDATPSAIILCPKCGNKTRVPESLFGTEVRCPECKIVYLAPTCAADGSIGLATLLPEAPAATPIGFKNSPLLIPGLLLFLVSLVGGFFEASIFYNFEWKKEETLASMKEAFRDPENAFRKSMEKYHGAKIEPEDLSVDNFRGISRHAIWFLPVNAIMFLGSLAILGRWNYRLALVGSGAAIVNLGFGCCLLSAPVGIFALVKLADPDSRKLFR